MPQLVGAERIVIRRPATAQVAVDRRQAALVVTAGIASVGLAAASQGPVAVTERQRSGESSNCGASGTWHFRERTRTYTVQGRRGAWML